MTKGPAGFSLKERLDYYPLVVQYTSDDRTRAWSLKFQSLPEMRITRTGPMPTRDEITQSLFCLNMPIMMIYIVEICAAVAEVTDLDKH